MKKISLLMMIATMFIVSDNFAQSTTTTTSTSAVATRGLELSIGAEGGLPIGTFKSESNYKFGGGGSVKLALPLANNLDGTISAGYMAFSRSKFRELTNENTFTAIPFKAGLRVRANPGLYFEPQVGYTQTKISNLEGSGVFTYAANVGFLVARALDIAVRYEAMASREGTSIAGATREDVSAKFIGLRIAYNIPFARSK